MWICKKSKEHKTFLATAHVTQDWEIDENNEFLKCTNDCTEVTHRPDSQDVVICKDCGSEAEWVKKGE